MNGQGQQVRVDLRHVAGFARDHDAAPVGGDHASRQLDGIDAPAVVRFGLRPIDEARIRRGCQGDDPAAQHIGHRIGIRSRIAPRHLDEGIDEGQHVLDPVTHFRGQQRLPLVRPGQLQLPRLALDGDREGVGDASHEGDVGGRELARIARIHLENAVRLAVAQHRDVEGTAHVVVPHQLRGPEAVLVIQMVRQDRRLGLEGEPGRTFEIRAQPRDPDGARLPADPCAHQEIIGRVLILEELAQIDIHALRGEAGGLVHHFVDHGRAQGEDTEFRDQLLLAQAIGELVLAARPELRLTMIRIADICRDGVADDLAGSVGARQTASFPEIEPRSPRMATRLVVNVASCHR